MNIYRLIIALGLVAAFLSQVGAASSYYGKMILSGSPARDGGMATWGNTVLVTILTLISLVIVVTAGGPKSVPSMWVPATTLSLVLVCAGTSIADYLALRRKGASETVKTLMLMALAGEAAVVITSFLAIILPVVNR